MNDKFDYNIFNDFLENYLPQGYLNINRDDPFIIALEDRLKKRNQFFYIADVVRLKLLFVSKGCKKILGVNPNDFDLSTMIDKMHPDNKSRYGLARVKFIKMGQDIFVRRSGQSMISSNFRIMSGSGKYLDILSQGYMFYSLLPYQSVFSLLVISDLSEFRISRHGYHFYQGDDLGYFRYPDAQLLKMGHIFSDREFEILQQIAAGLDSELIAKKMLLSINTVKTHRRNMLKKTKKSTTHDLVIELKEKGIL